MKSNELSIAQLNRCLTLSAIDTDPTFEIETTYKDVEFLITLSQVGAPTMSPVKLNLANGFSAIATNHPIYNKALTIEVKYTTTVSPYPPIERITDVQVITKETPIPSPIQSIISNVASMLDNKEFSDFKFVINNREFNVHKAILAGASDSFIPMFRVNGHSYKINEISEEVFGHLLRFIYTGKTPDDLDGIARELLEAASFFKIQQLRETCLEKIEAELTVANAMETYKWAFNHDVEELKMKAWKLVKQ
jgi:hypothetical protein